ncbi:hypothetical protein L1887_28463 [Cichorium endivia]|nr:hypothetical protein L1887_28463 [Cichorium endivia]
MRKWRTGTGLAEATSLARLVMMALLEDGGSWRVARKKKTFTYNPKIDTLRSSYLWREGLVNVNSSSLSIGCFEDVLLHRRQDPQENFRRIIKDIDIECCFGG